jgi:hypothetical protein
VSKVGQQHQLTVKLNGNVGTFTETWDAFLFEDDICTIVFNKENLEIEHIDIFDDTITEFDFSKIPEIFTIFKATRDVV